MAAQLTFKVLLDAGHLEPELVRMLVMGDIAPDPGNMGVLSDWLPEKVWPKVQALAKVKPAFEKIGDDMQ